MPKIAVFDSGLGSLSIIKSIQKKVRAEIIYFADQSNYPYGTKSHKNLRKIIDSAITLLKEEFEPDVIVVGSNTPSLLLNIKKRQRVIGVYPPLRKASKKTRTFNIAILATKSVVNSKALQNYIKKNVPTKIKVIKINASPLVDLVESGKFISQKKLCQNIIRIILEPLLKNQVDIATLSSTHLPFLLPMIKKIHPRINFLDPADEVTNKITKILKNKRSKAKLRIFASGNIIIFQEKLSKLGIKNKVKPL